MNKILYFENIAGIAGDMFAASFIDAGILTTADLKSMLQALGFAKCVSIEPHKVQKAGLQATHLEIKILNNDWKSILGVDHSHSKQNHQFVHTQKHHSGIDSHWHAHYQNIDNFLSKSNLEIVVKKFARDVFKTLAEAEGKVHGVDLEAVEFHEVGALDSILDVVMSGICFSKFSNAKFFSTPVQLGRGTVEIEHGTYPVPPPAVSNIVQGMPLASFPNAITRQNVELSTPTGVAILKNLNPQFCTEYPSGKLMTHGYGAGTMDLGTYPNVFRVSVLESSSSYQDRIPYEVDSVVEICCNIDDQTAEKTAWVCEELLKEAVIDVWQTPITLKKGRVAVQLSMLVKENDCTRICDWILRNTSSFGVRYQKWDRFKLVREFEKRSFDSGETVQYKIGKTTLGEVLKEKAEFEDIRKTWEQERN